MTFSNSGLKESVPHLKYWNADTSSWHGQKVIKEASWPPLTHGDAPLQLQNCSALTCRPTEWQGWKQRSQSTKSWIVAIYIQCQDVCIQFKPWGDWVECLFQIKTVQWEGDGYPDCLKIGSRSKKVNEKVLENLKHASVLGFWTSNFPEFSPYFFGRAPL